MTLESVFELQDNLLRGGGPSPRLAAQSARESSAARRATDIAPEQPDNALGVASGGSDGDYRLAVRVQGRALLSSARLQAFVEAASGEAEVRYVGGVEKLDGRTRSHRPLVCGVSVGHRDITAGTLGCFVTIDAGAAILSNNHVLADENRAKIGDPIIQPAQYDDGGAPDDVVRRPFLKPVPKVGVVSGLKEVRSERCTFGRGFSRGLESPVPSPKVRA
jgi:S1-C subfamily serine protease